MLLGLDIGSTALRACAINPSSGPSTLELFDTEDLPSGAVVNGVIAEPTQVIEALREILLRSAIESPRLAVSLPHSATCVHPTHLSFKRGRYDLRMAHEEIGPQLPSQWGAYHLSISPFDANDPEDVLLVAAPAAAVRSLQHIASAAGAELVGIDAAPAVGFNMLEHTGSLRGNVALVDVGLQESRILLIKDGRLRRTAVFPRGGQDLSESLQHALKLDPQEAELYKVGGESPGEGIVPRDVHEQLRVACQALADGIHSTLQKAAKSAGISKLTAIHCIGRGADLSLFYDALEELSRATITRPAPLSTLTCNPFDYTTSYLEAVRGASSFAFGSVLPWTS